MKINITIMKVYIQIISVCICMILFYACKENNWAEGVVSPVTSIENIRTLYKGSDVTISKTNLSAHQICGVVISDFSSGNIPQDLVVLQNTRKGITRGITLNLGESASTYLPGDSLVVEVYGTNLVARQGMLQLTGLNPSAVKKVSTDNNIIPRNVTCANLTETPDVYESTLVKVIAGNIDPVPAQGELFGGDKFLTDNTATLTVHTETDALLAVERLPASATFTGIPLLYNSTGNSVSGAIVRLWPRNAADITEASGPIYPGFPETFDSHPASFKSSFNMNTANVPNNEINLNTGRWQLYQCILGAVNTGYDLPISQPNSIRFERNLSFPALLEMKFDVPNGASKVTFWIGMYGGTTDLFSQWRLEYSIDQGATWTQTGEAQWATSKVKELAVFPLNITVPVRFRIYKYGPGSSDIDPSIQNGRLSVDDFSIYSN